MTGFTRAFPTADPRATALGLVNWSYEPEIAAVALTPTSKTIHFGSIWLPAGVPINYLWFWNSTAGAGTVPTSIYVFLDNGTSVVAQSGNLKSDAAWTAGGLKKHALATTYTPPVSGYHRVCFLTDLTATWGTTVLLLGNRTTTGISGKGDLLFEPWGTGGTAQTAPPSNGSALPALAVTTNALWVGASS